MTNMDGALASIREERAKHEAQRDRLQGELRGVKADIKRLTIAERALDPSAPKRSAGTSSVDAVLAVMQEVGKATQSEVAKAIAKPKNVAKAALEQLEERGLITRTGVETRRSPEFALVNGAGAEAAVS